MKKRIIVTLILSIGCIVIFRAGVNVGAASSTPGSVGDPLITQSYLEAKLEDMNGSNTYKKVNLSRGKTLLASEGSELLLYSGSGTVVGNIGLVSLTSGELFGSDMSFVLYHLYMSPAATSGIKANSDTIIYIKGDYKVR